MPPHTPYATLKPMILVNIPLITTAEMKVGVLRICPTIAVLTRNVENQHKAEMEERQASPKIVNISSRMEGTGLRLDSKEEGCLLVTEGVVSRTGWNGGMVSWTLTMLLMLILLRHVFIVPVESEETGRRSCRKIAGELWLLGSVA